MMKGSSTGLSKISAGLFHRRAVSGDRALALACVCEDPEAIRIFLGNYPMEAETGAAGALTTQALERSRREGKTARRPESNDETQGFYKGNGGYCPDDRNNTPVGTRVGTNHMVLYPCCVTILHL
jgi:hypothetical protein